VIARNTAFTYKGKPYDVKQIGRELNVRYVLEGSVQRSSNRLRVNVQLVDTGSGTHLWAERFDKPVSDLFDMQDEIVSRLANTLDTQLTAAEARRAAMTLHPDATDLYFLGRASVNKGQTLENLTQAHGYFERALALDPGNVEALVGAALVASLIGGSFLTDDRSARFVAAETASTKALSVAPDFAAAHFSRGIVYILTTRAVEGIAECEQALAVDQSRGECLHRLGQVSSRSRRGNRGPYQRGAPSLAPRYQRVPVDDVCWYSQVASRCRCRSGYVAPT
jgi:tetratricopeptide (TPR) repeat protein